MIPIKRLLNVALIVTACVLLDASASATPVLELDLAAGSSASVSPGDVIFVEISLSQTTVIPGQNLINDGVSNFGFTLDLNPAIGTVTGFSYAAGFEPDLFLTPALPSILSQSSSSSPPFVTKAASNALLLGTAEISVGASAAAGSQATLSVVDFNGGANFRFDNGGHGNVDAAVLAGDPGIQISAIPEPSSFVYVAVTCMALWFHRRKSACLIN